MSITFFIVGAVIFATYMYFTVWNIYNPQTKPKRKDYPNLGSEGCESPHENIEVETKQPKWTQNLEAQDEEDEQDLYSL